MPDGFLDVVRAVHVAIGAVTTFALFPAQMVNRKGNLWHIRIGRWVMWASIAIAASGGLMLLDPLFLTDFWPAKAEQLGYTAFFEHSYYEPMFFLFLMVTLLYYVLSGGLIWRRTARADDQGRVPSGPLDWSLTAVAGVFGLFYLAIGIRDIPSGEHYAWQFVGAGATLLPFVIVDCISFVPKWTVHLIKWWWLLHVLKLFNAWHGLVDAFLLRLEVMDVWVLAHRPLITRSVWLIEIVVIVVAMKRVRAGAFDADGGTRRRMRRAAIG